jgi:hypothetical protein
LLAGLLAVAALPAAIAIAQVSTRVKLTQAAAGAPVAALLGGVALLLARRARRRAERTLGRAGGENVARAGRVLGVLGLCLAASAAIAIGFYGLLVHYQ